MPFPLLVPGAMSLGSFLGGLFGNNSSQQPTVDPAYGPLQSLLLQTIQNRLANPTQLPAGFEAGGIRGINSSYNAAEQNLAARNTAAGLSASPIGQTGFRRAELARAGDVGSFRAGLPLLQQQLQDQNIGLAENLLTMGRGMTGSTGGGAGGGFDSLATMLGYLYGKGAFKGMGGNGLPGYTTTIG